MSSEMVDRWNRVLNKTYRDTKIGETRRAIRLRVVEKPFKTMAIDIYEDGEFLDRVIIGHFDTWINIANAVWNEMIVCGYLFDRTDDDDQDNDIDREDRQENSRRRGGSRSSRRSSRRRPRRE